MQSTRRTGGPPFSPNIDDSMNHPESHRPSPMMRRIVAAALHRRRLILFWGIFAVCTAVASFVPIIATVLKSLLALLPVLFLHLITFRGAIVQDLVRKLTQYFVPQHQ